MWVLAKWQTTASWKRKQQFEEKQKSAVGKVAMCWSARAVWADNFFVKQTDRLSVNKGSGDEKIFEQILLV